MKIDTNNIDHLPEFIRLNEIWISEYFSLEDADKALAADPGKIIENGGFVFSLESEGRVIGVCALFRDSPERFQLARLAVEPSLRGRGYGRKLVEHALKQAKANGARSVYLLSNTILEPAIALYKAFDFVTVSSGSHPVYARCNIVMECQL